jgi:hypothetical protein
MITRLATAALVVILAFDSGSFSLESRTTLAIVVWWALGLAVLIGVLPRRPPEGLTLAVGGVMLLFAGLTALSIAWAPSAEKAFAEVDRVVLYLGVFALLASFATRENARALSDGIAIGISFTGVAALTTRLFPDLAPENDLASLLPEARTRLSYPLGYWNGLAILLALSLPLLLHAALAAERRLWRAIALATLPALAATTFLTSSRGGVAVAVLSIGTFLVLTDNRRRAAGAIAAAAAGSVAAIAVLFAHPVLIDGPFDTPAAESAGRATAALILLCCAATVLLYAVIEHPFPVRVPTMAKLSAVTVAAALLIAFLAASDPIERIGNARASSDEWSSVRGHFLNLGDSKRTRIWSSAVDQFTAHPVVGEGAGSFEAWWSEHRTVPSYVRDAHSLYLETLGELGLIGFALISGVIAAGLIVGIGRTTRSDGADRTFAASLTAAFAGFAGSAAEDWMWEMTIVSVVGVTLLALLVGDATRSDPRPSKVPPPAWMRVLVGGLMVVAMGAAAVVLLSAVSLKASQKAAARGDMAYALRAADRTRAFQPWAASSHLQLALLLETTGDLVGARTEIHRALARDERDWRLWLVAARIEVGLGNVAAARVALARVRRLNPLLPVFTNV